MANKTKQNKVSIRTSILSEIPGSIKKENRVIGHA